MDTFGTLKAKELKVFIITHNDELTKLGDIPNRGKVEEAKRDPPVQNSILMAYNCRLNPNLLNEKIPYSAEELAKFADNDEDDDDNATNQRFDTVRLGAVDQVPSSELLGSNL